MKKENFIALVMGVVGGVLFALGMCMCLLPEWNAFTPGVVLGILGAVVLVAMWLIRRKMLGKAPIQISRKTLSAIALGVVGALVLGTGMCMCMVWQNLLVPGVIVGILGILLLLCLIPLCKGLK